MAKRNYYTFLETKNKVADQPVRLHRLVCVLVVRINKNMFAHGLVYLIIPDKRIYSVRFMSKFSLIYCQKDENEWFWNLFAVVLESVIYRTNSFCTNTIISIPKERMLFLLRFCPFWRNEDQLSLLWHNKVCGSGWGLTLVTIFLLTREKLATNNDATKMWTLFLKKIDT